MPDEKEIGKSRVVQMSNISPTATREQIYQLCSYLGRIEEIRTYPSETHSSFATMAQRLCYVRFEDSKSVETAQHLTNTVFIDRALICVPVPDSKIPEEETALKTGGPAWPGQRQLPPNVVNQIQHVGDHQMLVTLDPTLQSLGLQGYPPLPANTDASKIEEIRRTVYVGGIPIEDMDPTELMKFFNDNIGEVMYLRMAGGEQMPQRCAYIEFSSQHTVPTALQNSGIEFKGSKLRIVHSRVAIIKPLAKTQDMAQKEVEEAMKKQKNAGLPGSLTSSSLNRGLSNFGMEFPGRSRSPPWRSRGRRTRSRSRTLERSRERRGGRRSRSRDKKRSGSKDKKRSRSRDRKDRKTRRSRSKDKRRSKKSKSRSKSPARKKDKDKDKKKEIKAEPSTQKEKKEIKKEDSSGGEESDSASRPAPPPVMAGRDEDEEMQEQTEVKEEPKVKESDEDSGSVTQSASAETKEKSASPSRKRKRSKSRSTSRERRKRKEKEESRRRKRKSDDEEEKKKEKKKKRKDSKRDKGKKKKRKESGSEGSSSD